MTHHQIQLLSGAIGVILGPEQPPIAPEAYELADGPKDPYTDFLKLAANLVKAADDIAKAFSLAVAPIAKFYDTLTPEQKLTIAEINFRKEAPEYARTDKDREVQDLRGKGS